MTSIGLVLKKLRKIMYVLAMISLKHMNKNVYEFNIVKISNSVILLLRSTEEICMFVNVAFIAAEVRRVC